MGFRWQDDGHGKDDLFPDIARKEEVGGGGVAGDP